MPIFVGRKEYKIENMKYVYFGDTLASTDVDYFYLQSLQNSLPTDAPDHSEFVVKATIVAPGEGETAAQVYYAKDTVDVWTEITTEIQTESGHTISALEGQKIYIYSKNPSLTKDVVITCSNTKNYRRTGGTKGLLSDYTITIK